MALWWCVASTEARGLERALAWSSTGLLAAAAFEQGLGWPGDAVSLVWAACLLTSFGTALLTLRRSRRPTGPFLVVDGLADLQMATPSAVHRVFPTASWRLGPWQFVRLRAGAEARSLVIDRRACNAAQWAALQRALVRGRRAGSPRESAVGRVVDGPSDRIGSNIGDQR